MREGFALEVANSLISNSHVAENEDDSNQKGAAIVWLVGLVLFLEFDLRIIYVLCPIALLEARL